MLLFVIRSRARRSLRACDLALNANSYDKLILYQIFIRSHSAITNKLLVMACAEINTKSVRCSIYSEKHRQKFQLNNGEKVRCSVIERRVIHILPDDAKMILSLQKHMCRPIIRVLGLRKRIWDMM